MALAEWAQSRGIAVTSLSVGDCRIEMMPQRPTSTGGVTATDRSGVKSLYQAFGGELLDEAALGALQNAAVGEEMPQ